MKIERYMSQNDASVLSRLAYGMLRFGKSDTNLAERLIDIISGAMLLPETSSRRDYVCLYSVVTYRRLGSVRNECTVIVCPQDCDDVLVQISILAPLALALLGRAVGSIVEVPLPFGRIQYVEIIGVAPIGQQPTLSKTAIGRPSGRSRLAQWQGERRE